GPSALTKIGSNIGLQSGITDRHFQSHPPDGRHLLTLDQSGRIVTMEMPGGIEISSFQVKKPGVRSAVGLCLSPNGSKLAVDSDSGRGVEIWEPKTGTRLYSLPEESGTVYGLTWSSDSQRLAVARDNGNIAIWNLDTVGQILAQIGL